MNFSLRKKLFLWRSNQLELLVFLPGISNCSLPKHTTPRFCLSPSPATTNGHYIIPFRSCAFNLLREIFLKSATFKLKTSIPPLDHQAKETAAGTPGSLYLTMTLLPDARCTLVQLAKSLFYFLTERTVSCSYWQKSYNNIFVLNTSFSVLNRHYSGLYPPPFRLQLCRIKDGI